MLRVEDLTIRGTSGSAGRLIVSGVDLVVNAGETVGIVGESGSGKSMTARAVMGLLPKGYQAEGSVLYGGRNLLTVSERTRHMYRGSEIGMVFQDPFTMLNPVRRCGRHVTEVLRDSRGRKLRRGERRSETTRRLAEVGLDARVAARFPFELSGGMRQRVGIASALARDPKILIADEPSTALDVTIQREILRLLRSVQQARGMGLILITHDLRVAFSMCDRIYVLYAGQLLEVGPSASIEDEPRHPYTLGLLMSEPPLEERRVPLASIPGSVPAADSVLDQCPFSGRCKWAAPVCTSGPTPLQAIGSNRATACRRTSEIRQAMIGERGAKFSGRSVDVVPTSADLILSTAEVRKAFAAGGRNELIALNGVSLDVGENESVALVGESGSGKTTFGRCVVGLESVTSGSIEVGGVCASSRSLSTAEMERLRKTVQFVFQDPYSSLNPARTIGFTLSEAILIKDPQGRRVGNAVDELLIRVGLPSEYKRLKPVALSGGERQRVAIARALAVEPRLLICDEPVSALDVSVQAQILNLFARLRQEFGMSYLFISHDLAVVRQIADRAYVLRRGEVVEAGEIEQLLNAPSHPYTRQLLEAVPRTDTGWLGESSVAAAGD